MKGRRKKSAKKPAKGRGRKAARKKAGRKKTARRRVAKRVPAGKRKTTRKTARKRKTTRKKKTSGRRPAAGRGHRSISIRESRATSARHSAAQGAPVVWKSKDIAYTLTFLSGWPFVETADIGTVSISVPAGGSSRTFTVGPVTPRQYDYSVDPPPSDTRRPNPIVIVVP